MSYLVVLIIDDLDDCLPVLNAWEDIGVSGVTILTSTGLGRMRRAGLRDDIPLMPSLRALFEGDEVDHRTLLSVVEDQNTVDKMVTLAQEIIGDLDDPHTGFMFVVPVLKAFGLGRQKPTE
jgi:nitrogen regulatory protein PII